MKSILYEWTSLFGRIFAFLLQNKQYRVLKYLHIGYTCKIIFSAFNLWFYSVIDWLPIILKGKTPIITRAPLANKDRSSSKHYKHKDDKRENYSKMNEWKGIHVTWKKLSWGPANIKINVFVTQKITLKTVTIKCFKTKCRDILKWNDL